MTKYWFPTAYRVTFPQDVQAFERKNSVPVNVYGYGREQRFVYPLKFRVYDFEAILEAEHMGQAYEKHVPSSFCLLVIRSTVSGIVEQFLYRGEDCVEKFISILNQLSKLIGEWIRSEEVPMVSVNEEAHASASHCAICGESFGSRKRKVRDHDYFSGSYRQSLCQRCNLNLRVNKKVIPVLAHNHLYDLAFILPKHDLFESKDIKVLATSCQQFNRLDHVELLVRKGVFPCDYVTSFEAYREPELPPCEPLYKKLNNSQISEEDYRHAKSVFETSNFKNTYELDPLHYVSLPALSLACALEQTEVKLELLDDVDAYLFIEAGLRGGIVQCAIRNTRADVSGTACFNQNTVVSQILDVDVNGLYASTMRQHLPCADFRWLDRAEIDALHLQPEGYILDVDLDYPRELHDSHADFPLAPEERGVPFEWLSPCQKALVEKFHLPQRESKRKLLLTFYPKRNYIIHYRNLKLYLEMGLKLKTIENPRQYNNVVISVSEDEVPKTLQKPNLRQFAAISPTVVIFQFSQRTLHLNKPEYAGFFILEMSKLVMYEFFYKQVRRVFPDARAAYSDTDSFILQITDPNVDSKLATLAETHLDTSGYPVHHPLFSPANKMKLGVFKSELPKDHILGFVCLKPELYLMELASREHYVRAKGVKRCEFRKLTYELYVQTLEQQTLYKITQRIIARKLCENMTVVVEKIRFNPFDNKRFIDSDGVSTLPFGHWSFL
ncbi:uncharacterized protein LOC121837740 [Ixodes scapularis]|uniref:uncharacterized protein LOC121837740 n=1 Tax=Ixodes scapularis TaxID=6945 RepID=UPI001C386311|nr:uncharacterized protein LOC121837740 [Ixodes scapularis]